MRLKSQSEPFFAYQKPVYKNYNASVTFSDGQSMGVNANNMIVKEIPQVLIELDPKYDITKNLNAWLSFRYFGKTYANLQEVLLGQWVELDDVVKTVQEFRLEVLAHHLAGLFSLVMVLFGTKADSRGFDALAGVGGHDDDRVLEGNGAALRVSQAAVIHDLQEEVQDVRVGLFNFVQQDQAVWVVADALCTEI